ncbi:hypothetical protein EDD17DRAFT_885819 [Pisolithus thermaeus]|nr:hypothetical protein EDD17DRAFT_885819 [Pisolithus thermaeus]
MSRLQQMVPPRVARSLYTRLILGFGVGMSAFALVGSLVLHLGLKLLQCRYQRVVWTALMEFVSLQRTLRRIRKRPSLMFLLGGDWSVDVGMLLCEYQLGSLMLPSYASRLNSSIASREARCRQVACTPRPDSFHDFPAPGGLKCTSCSSLPGSPIWQTF